MRSPSPQATGISPISAWGALAILAGLNLFNYLDRYVMSAVLPLIKKDLVFTDAGSGWAASAFMLGYFVTAPVFGYLGDRYPRKYLMLIGVIIWSLATAASGLAHGFVELFSIRMVVGVGEAVFVTMGPSWISDVFAATRRNTALTIFYVAIPVGSAIGFTIGGLFAGHGDWRGAFIFAGLPGVLLALLLLTLREPTRGQADGVVEQIVPKANPVELLTLMQNRRYNLLIWGYAAQTFAIGAFGVWGPSFLQRVHGLALGEASTIFGAMLLGAGLIATPLGGFISNRLRARRPAGYSLVLAASLTIAMPFCFVALLVGNATLCLVALGASMFCLFLPTGPIASEMFEIVPVHLRASAMALCTFIIHLFGDFGSPTIVGNVSTWAGDNLRVGVMVLPFVLMVGAALWWVLVAYTREPLKIET